MPNTIRNTCLLLYIRHHQKCFTLYQVSLEMPPSTKYVLKCLSLLNIIRHASLYQIRLEMQQMLYATKYH